MPTAKEILAELLAIDQGDRECRYLAILARARESTVLVDETRALVEGAESFGMLDWQVDAVVAAVDQAKRFPEKGLLGPIQEHGAGLDYVFPPVVFAFAEEMLFAPGCDCEARRLWYGFPIAVLGWACLERSWAPRNDVWSSLNADQQVALLYFVAMNVLSGDLNHVESWTYFYSDLSVDS